MSRYGSLVFLMSALAYLFQLDIARDLRDLSGGTCGVTHFPVNGIFIPCGLGPEEPVDFCGVLGRAESNAIVGEELVWV
jgi:hypothetical protein